ncbi:MAG: peptidoglycan-binding protein [Fischerella sp.]|uniref:peptidoglycan-binding domain-containing protein n=1 Tax=Fischerella sp. TaxID=1191 RepID=UPI00185767A8|nr:peptidoglycan-binding protein [Fischerella sp.]NWF58994.1 peptidoglycan-binding protein [Fischerella sp.]
MKKIISALLSLGFLLIAAPGIAQVKRQWVYMGSTHDGNYYVDVNSIKGEGNYRTVWYKREVSESSYSILYGSSSPGRTYVKQVTNFYIDCDSRRIGVLQGVTYYSSGEIQNRYESPLGSYPEKMGSVYPESIGESVLEYVCSLRKNTQTKPPVKQSTNFNQQDLPKLELNSTGNAVELLQQKLKKFGFFKQEVTGFFGPITKDAVLKFQTSRGIPTDGVVGQQTWRELLK